MAGARQPAAAGVLAPDLVFLCVVQLLLFSNAVGPPARRCLATLRVTYRVGGCVGLAARSDRYTLCLTFGRAFGPLVS